MRRHISEMEAGPSSISLSATSPSTPHAAAAEAAARKLTVEAQRRDFVAREKLNPGLHSKFNRSGLVFLKESFLVKLHDILDKGIPDGESSNGQHLKFAWNDLKCPLMQEQDPVLEIVEDQGFKGSIVIDFSINGKWFYDYKKGLLHWHDSGTFFLMFKKLKIAITMNIELTPEKELRLYIPSGGVEVEAEDVDIKMKSKGMMTQGIINLALPSFRNLWKKPQELSRQIEDMANANLKEIVQLLPVSFPLPGLILGTAFYVGNLFENDIYVDANWCAWQLSSVIVPTEDVLRWLDIRAAKKGRPRSPEEEDDPALRHPFSTTIYDISMGQVPNMANLPKTRGIEKHLCYCISEFTLNTIPFWIHKLRLADFAESDWAALPHYLQRYILTFTRVAPHNIFVEAALKERPHIFISPDGIVMKLSGFVTVAADVEDRHASVKSLATSASNVKQPVNPPFKQIREESLRRWSLFHKSRHDILFHMEPKFDKDFVVRFSFEKKSIASEFEAMENRTESFLTKSEEIKRTTWTTILEIVENMLIVELIPQLSLIGDVGVPLAINDGCQFEVGDLLLHHHAIVINGYLRFKDFRLGHRRTAEEEEVDEEDRDSFDDATEE